MNSFLPGPPPCVSLRRAALLTSEEVHQDDQWGTFDVALPVEHKRVDFTPGMILGVYTKPANRAAPCKVVADDSVPIWNISSFDRCLAWNVTHLFAGAYEGWLRAMWWLQQAIVGVCFATHTSVDWSLEAMKTWEFNHGCTAHAGPVPVSFNPTTKINGITVDISEPTLLRASANKSNLLMTLSPPCPSWSKGGKNSGLATDEGFCFLDAIEHISRVRPVIAIFECSDGIEAHPHWRILSAALQLAGYHKMWSQDLAIHQLTSNYRTRWLAVWVRNDIPFSKCQEHFTCTADRRLSWNYAKHQHPLPSSLEEGLVLQAPQLRVYGDYHLLPPAKRGRGDDLTESQVLSQRLVQHGEFLPTLCASYTAQHLLQRDHIESKGLFANLVQKDGKFCFIDPFVFVTLFGTTDSIALPTELRTAFHQLGNAISQIHALFGVLVGIEGVTKEPFQKQALALQCWDDRLTADSAIVRVCDNMYALQPLADFVAKALPSIATWQPWLVDHALVRFCDDVSLVPINIDDHCMVTDQLLSSLDLGAHHRHLLRLHGDDGVLPPELLWRNLPVGHLQVKLGTLNLCELNVVRTGTIDPRADPILSPTQPWDGEEVDIELDQLQDAHHSGFFHVAEYLCQDDYPRHTAKILLLQQDGSSEWINDATGPYGQHPSFPSGKPDVALLQGQPRGLSAAAWHSYCVGYGSSLPEAKISDGAKSAIYREP